MEPKRLVRQADSLFSSVERFNNDKMWNELSEFMLNNQYNFFMESTATGVDISGATSTSPGAKKTRRLFDSTALQAVQDLAAAFQGTLTNPATQWSRLRFQEEVLNNDEEAVNWLSNVNRKMHNKFNESNFNTEIGKCYQSLVALGNAAMFLELDGANFQFTSIHMGQIAWSEDRNSMVDTIYRRIDMTAKQAVDRWGKDIDSEIVKCSIEKPEEVFQFLHAIYPRQKFVDDGPAPPEKRKFASVYIDTKHHAVVEEDGYYEMPLQAIRWGLMPNERYGRGPGHLALPDTRTLNKVKELSLRAIAKQIDPPMLVNKRDFFGTLDIRPGSLSVVKDHRGVSTLPNSSRHDVTQFEVQELRTSIKSIFHLDKLLLPPRTETGEMTAFEIGQRIEQMQRVLGPVLSRLNHELLNPLVVRSFKLMMRNGELPEIPDILKERGIDVEIVFVNQLARAQQIQDVNTIQQWVQNVAQLAQLNPAAIDYVNVDGIVKHTASILGVPEEAVQNEDMVIQLREQRAQAAQQQQALEAGVKAADINSKLGGQ